jgi:hypothetical protein
MMHVADCPKTIAIKIQSYVKPIQLMTVSPALRNRSCAAGRAHVKSPELLTEQLSAISVPK